MTSQSQPVSAPKSAAREDEGSGAHTPGPLRATRSAAGHSDMRDDMFDWCSAVYCSAPYQESDDSDLPGVTVVEQVVAHAYGRTADEALGNAHLYASAPDMLEALRGARSLASMAVMSDDEDGTPSKDQQALERLRAQIDAAISKATAQ